MGYISDQAFDEVFNQALNKEGNYMATIPEKTNSFDIKEVSQMIDECEDNSHHLSDWECSFIDELSFLIDEDEYLSENQIEKLKEIHEKATM